MLKPTDDDVLAAEALRGDRDAFRRLIERHYDMIYRIAYRYLRLGGQRRGHRPGRLHRAGEQARPVQGQEQVHHVALHGRDQRLPGFFAAAEVVAGLMERYGVQRAMDEADQADDEKRAAWLQQALAGLEPNLGGTVLLVVGEEMAHAEAAEILGCAESTVSWRMHTVKKLLAPPTGRRR